MSPLNVVLFLDQRPGHEKQSRGIIKALESYTEVEMTEVVVIHQSALRDIAAYLGFFLHLDRSPCKNRWIDLAIGSGSRTHIPLLSCKRASQARAVTCMTPSWLLKHYFDLCFVPRHDRPAHVNNMFPTVGPPNIATAGNSHEHHKSLILVGGEDPCSHTWNQERLESYIRELLSRSESQIWTISSSPRTPKLTSNMLESMAKEHTNVSFYPFSATESGWVEKQYALNKNVWVTGDSISMVYEALSAGCNVGILPVDWKKENNKFHLSEQYLVTHQWVVSFADWQKGTVQWPDRVQLCEADRCAKELLRRWWPEKLL